MMEKSSTIRSKTDWPLERALDFYVHKLGFEKTFDMTMGDGYRWIEVKPPGAETGIALAPAQPGNPAGGTVPCIFTSDDIDATYEELSGRGVHFTEKPTAQPWGAKQALFSDPDGHTYVLVDRP